MNISKLSGYIACLFGIVYILWTYFLPNASYGEPYAPKIFPYALGILMIFFGVLSIVKEFKTLWFVRKDTQKTGKQGTSGTKSQGLFIGKVVLASLLYAILMDRLGYIISTILFMGAIMYIFNGIKKPLRSLLVVLFFSFGIYLTFSTLLGIHLPSPSF